MTKTISTIIASIAIYLLISCGGGGGSPPPPIPPTIMSQPQAATVSDGSTVSLSVVAGGDSHKLSVAT